MRSSSPAQALTRTLTLALALSAAAPLAFSELEVEAKPAPASALKPKAAVKTTKKKGDDKDLKKKKEKEVKGAPAKGAPAKRAPAKPKTIEAVKSPTRTTSEGKASGLKVKGAKGVGASAEAPAAKGAREAAPAGDTKPARGAFGAPAHDDAKPSHSVVRPTEQHLAPKGAELSGPKRTTLKPTAKPDPEATTTTTTTTKTTTMKKGKKVKKGVKRVEQTGGAQSFAPEPSYGVAPGGGGGGYAPARPRVPSCRPEGSVLMANLGVGFESTQGIDSSSMAYVFGGGLRSGILGLAAEAQFNQRDGESEMTAWGGQVRLYIPLGTCLDVYPLAGMSQQKAALEQFNGNTTAYDLGVGADFNLLGRLAFGARYTRSFFVDELQKVQLNDTANSRDTFVVQLSLFF
jgi:opacity protein-like surface antigen